MMNLDGVKDYGAMCPDPRENNLPRYAQSTISDLRRTVNELIATVREARMESDTEKSSAFLRYHDAVPLGLGATAEVTFKLPGLNRTVEARVSDDGLALIGSGQLVIMPRASNAIVVAVYR